MNIPLQAQPAALRRRSAIAPFLAAAWLQGYWCVTQIRTNLLINWSTGFVEMLLARQLWIALFNGQATFDGYTLDQTLTYAVLSMALFSLMKGDAFLYWKIRSGNILNDLMHPLRFPSALMASSIASILYQVIIQAGPQILLAVLVLGIPMPASLGAWLAFGLSFLLGCIIYNCLDILANMLGFWTTEMHGIIVWKDILAGICSGAFLPLWIFPSPVERVLSWLPFRGMQYVPLSILVGWIPPAHYLRELGIQLVWVVLLWLVVEAMFELAMRKYEVQGG
jgi:ABC-2 type transport system permease protein